MGLERLETDRRKEIENRNILIVEDCFDSGATMIALQNTLKKAGAKSVKSAIAFHKRNPNNLKLNFRADYTAFEVANDFICGYGLDYNENFRDVEHLFAINKKGIEAFK